MPNRKFTTARAVAFWLGLTLHLSLGTALYYHISSPGIAQGGHPEQTQHATAAYAKP